MTPAIAFADAKDLERLEENEKTDKAISAVVAIDDYLHRVGRDNKTSCLKAFGHEMFCNCLSDNMPGPGMIVLSFYEYIAATTKSKEDLKYNQLPEDQKKMIDALRKTREICVEELNR
jgi:hypothetical protein